MPKSKLSAAGYLLLVFLSGVLVGGSVQRFYMTKTVSAAPRPEDFRKQYVNEMRTSVKLDDQQMQQLQQVLDDTRQKYHDLREQEKPMAQKIHDDQVTRINAMLRPEQIPLYAQFREERARKRREAEKKGKQ